MKYIKLFESFREDFYKSIRDLENKYSVFDFSLRTDTRESPKDSKLFESVGSDLTHILYEINDETDETYWKANCWPDSQDGKWVVVIETVDSPDEPEEEGLRPTPSVIETIKRAIEFMDGEGFTNYEITFNNEDDDQYEEINLEEVSDLDVWSNNFIRIDFWK